VKLKHVCPEATHLGLAGAQLNPTPGTKTLQAPGPSQQFPRDPAVKLKHVCPEATHPAGAVVVVVVVVAVVLVVVVVVALVVVESQLPDSSPTPANPNLFSLITLAVSSVSDPVTLPRYVTVGLL